jgi:hypothetical protein
MNEETIKKHLISAAITFGATFFTFLGATLATGDIVWSKAALVAIFITAIRTSVKAVLDGFIPVRLGGRK